MKFTPFFAIIGLVMGIPVSYWFQPEALRRKISLGKYLSSLPELLEPSRNGSMRLMPPDEVFGNIVIACILCGVVLGLLGLVVDQQQKRVV